MKRILTIIVGLLLLLTFAQCTKDKEKEQNIQLTNEAVDYIEDNLQLQLDLLADKDDAEVLESLAEWVKGLEGVESAMVNNGHVEINHVDKTKSRIDIIDRTIVDPESENFQPMREMLDNAGSLEANDFVIGGTKGFVWDAFSEYFTFEYENVMYNDAQAIRTLLNNKMDIVYLADDLCTVDALRHLTDYAFVYLATHGNVDVLFTGEHVTNDNREKYREEMEEGKVGRDFVAYKVDDRGRTFKAQYFFVTNAFIDALDGRFNNAMVLNASCLGLVENQPFLCRSFVNKGVSTYFGYDESVCSLFAYQTNVSLVLNLLLGHNTGDSYNRVIKAFPFRDYEDEHGRYLHTTHYCIEGAKDLALFDVPPVSSEGLVAYYPFNGNANDESGNGHDGEVIGNVTLSEGRKGEANGAYRFYGEPYNYISIPDDEAFHLSTFTLNAWVYTYEDNYGSEYLICKGRDINNGSYRLCVSGVGATNQYGAINDASVEECPRVQEWHMITGTVQGDQAKFYIDGFLMDEKTLTNPFEFGNSDPLTLGMHYYVGVPDYWAYPLVGVIDDVRIYNRVLTPEEILCLYKE